MSAVANILPSSSNMIGIIYLILAALLRGIAPEQGARLLTLHGMTART